MSIYSYFSPISVALLPNAESDDVFLILKMLLPWNWGRWFRGKETTDLEKAFKRRLSVKNAFGFSSGRIGLYAILKSLETTADLYSGDQGEVIIQAYTTIALPLAIEKAGYKPIYTDMQEETYNIDPDKIQQKITPRTKALIVQHTFGIPAQMDKIISICKKNNLLLIEDCAHSLGAEYDDRKIGTFGDAAFFSFGRDKIISSTSGGMVVTNNEKIAERMKKIHENLDFPPPKWVLRQLMHPLIFWCALPLYYFFSLGKLLVFAAQKSGIIVRAYSKKEKSGVFEGTENDYILPNISAILTLNQFKKMDRFNEHRRMIAERYEKEFRSAINTKAGKIKIAEITPKTKPVYLYYTIQVEKRDEILKFAAQKHIVLGDWFPGALSPKGVNEKSFGYKNGECPIAEKVGLRSLNLPTGINISEKDTARIIEVVKIFNK